MPGFAEPSRIGELFLTDYVVACEVPSLLLLIAAVGAVVLARNRPDPRPLVLGYHEIWHSFVVGARSCQFTLVLLLVRA